MAIRSVASGTGRVRTPGRGIGTSGSTGGGGGPTSAEVQALLHFDGTNGSTTITDSSTYARTWLLSGSCEISTTVKKFGTASLSVNLAGSSTTRLSTPDVAPLSPGSQDFTIDCWIYWSGVTNGVFNPQILRKSLINNFEFSFAMLGGAANAITPQFYWTTDGTTLASMSGATFTPTLNTWYLLSFSKNGTSGRIFVNGVQSGSTGTVAASIFEGTGVLYVLTDATNNLTFNGRLDDLRYVVGTGLYTADFTPPSAAWPNP